MGDEAKLELARQIVSRLDPEDVKIWGYDRDALFEPLEQAMSERNDLAYRKPKLNNYVLQRKIMLALKKDIDNQQFTNSNMRNDLNDYLAEKEALERHSRILLGQNDDLTKELERFVNTDEVLRQQLDRRGRVYDMQARNNQEMGFSQSKV